MQSKPTNFDPGGGGSIQDNHALDNSEPKYCCLLYTIYSFTENMFWSVISKPVRSGFTARSMIAPPQ